MFYTIYKVTNKINNKFYIGMHQTENLNDAYMGSGKLIRQAIQKYGVVNFTKEILHIFDNEEDMKNKEKELVIISEKSYNLCEGGKGGFSYLNRSGKALRTGAILSEETKKKISKSKKGSKLSDEQKQWISENNPMKNEEAKRKMIASLTGKPKSEEHKKKISESLKRKYKQAGVV